MCFPTRATCALIIAAIALPASAGVISPDGVVSLTPAEREAALDSAAAAADGGVLHRSRTIHGEAGFEMDSRGGHAIYGTAVMPLGSSGVVALSFLNGNMAARRGAE